VVNKLHKFIRL